MISRVWTVLFLLSFSLTANAELDVNCFMSDCLSEGWQVYDKQTGRSQVVSCTNMDCEQFGWRVTEFNNPVSEAVCKIGGCFVEGWREYNRFGQLVAEVTCGKTFNGRNCFEFGWNTYYPGRPVAMTRCRGNDCGFTGWVVRSPGFLPQTAICKVGGCFTTGWTVIRNAE